MSIAQRLCNEIVEPVLNTTQNYNTYPSPKKLSNFSASTPTKHHGSATKSIVIQKKRVISKLAPREAEGSKIIVSRLKSQETILKKRFVDIAVNTYISGPLKCDNDCVTNVRKRDTRCVCKCSHKHLTNHSGKSNAKQIQTQKNVNYLIADKACAQTIETVSCGTQFLERLGVATQPQRECTKRMVNKETMAPFIMTSSERNERPRLEPSSQHNNQQRPSHVNFISKRWALSPYPVRGPDF